DSLVVPRIHAELVGARDLSEAGLPAHEHVVPSGGDAHAVFPAPRAMRLPLLEVLQQRAAKDDVQQLEAAADAEQRDALGEGVLDEGALYAIALRVDGGDALALRLAVE